MAKITTDLLVSMYGRSHKYNDDNWDIIGGPLMGEKYLKFKRLADEICPDYFKVAENAEFPNGEKLLAQELFAAINGQINGFGNTGSWAWHTAELSKEMEDGKVEEFPSEAFNKGKLRSDIDAINLRDIYNSNYIVNLESYLSGVTDQSRTAQVYKNGSLSGQTWTKKDKGELDVLMGMIDTSDSGFTRALNSVEKYIDVVRRVPYKIAVKATNYEDFNDAISIVTSNGKEYTGDDIKTGLTFSIGEEYTVALKSSDTYMKNSYIIIDGKPVEKDAEGKYTFTVSSDKSINFVFNDKPSVVSNMTSDELQFSAPESIYDVQIPDFSSLALSRKSAMPLYAVSNTRTLPTDGNPQGGIYEIYINENGITCNQTWCIPGKEKASSELSYEDTEAIAINRSGDTFLGLERLQELVKPTGTKGGGDCNYDTIRQFDFSGGTRGHYPAATIETDGYNANEGIEGVDILSGNVFFVSNSVRPSEVTLFDANKLAVLNSQILEDPVKDTEIWETANGKSLEFEIADLAYIRGLNELWIMNSERGVIYRYSVNAGAASGDTYLTYINSISMPIGSGVTVSKADDILHYIVDDTVSDEIVNNNPEALVVNENEGKIYIGAEGFNGGTAPGKLYIFNFYDIKKKEYGDLTPFDVYMTQTEELYQLAKQTINETTDTTSKPQVTNADQLVSMYGRSKTYNSGKWSSYVGSLSGPQYTAFKAKADAAYPNYLDVKTLETPNGDTFDVPHFWATINGQIVGYPNLIGWGGDLAQFAGDYESNQSIIFPSNRFGIEDFVADLDAYNLGNLGTANTGYITSMREYFSAITQKKRCELFTSDNKTILKKYDSAKDNTDMNTLFIYYTGSLFPGSTRVTVSTMMQNYIDNIKKS